MIVLYRGASPWLDPRPEGVFAPEHRSLARQWFGGMPAHVFDMHHMDEGEIPSQDTLRLVFDLERSLTEPTRFLSELAQRIRRLPARTDIAALYGEERAQGLRDALSRFAQTAVRRWPDLPADWGAQQDSSLEALEMMGQQVDTRYPTLRQEGLREGLREAQLEYVEERYGVAARQAVADFLDSLATDEKVSFADLDGLVEAWHDGSDLPSWWRNH